MAHLDYRDFVYCDPPYSGRSTDYFNRWTDDDDDLRNLLEKYPAGALLSSWFGNQYRINPRVTGFSPRFHILKSEHFYYIGGLESNRHSMVEALALNYDPDSPEGADRVNTGGQSAKLRASHFGDIL